MQPIHIVAIIVRVFAVGLFIFTRFYCFGRVFGFEFEGFPIEGVGPGELEEVAGENSSGLDSLVELPVGEAGGLGKGGEIGVAFLSGAMGLGFEEGFSPVFKVGVDFGGETQVDEAHPEFLS